MRVVAGNAKGTVLKSLKGKQIRPTSDKVKEAMFSMLQPFINGSTVLDLFAGSGSLGIEALSRGADFCSFVEKSNAACQIAAANLEKTKLSNFKIHFCSAKDFLIRCKQKYDIVFLDPPYNQRLCAECLSLLLNYDLLNQGAIIVCETDLKEEINSSLNVVRQSKYGETRLTLLQNS